MERRQANVEEDGSGRKKKRQKTGRKRKTDGYLRAAATPGLDMKGKEI